MTNQVTAVALALIEVAALLFPVLIISLQLGKDWWEDEELVQATRVGLAVMISLLFIIGASLMTIVNEIDVSLWLCIALAGVIALGITFSILIYHIHRAAKRRTADGMD